MNSLRMGGQVVLAAIIALGMPAHAPAEQQADGRRSISVVGEGEAGGAPDQAQVSVGVQTSATTVVEAARENQSVVERIMKALEDHEIDEGDMQTANYSIWPEQRHDPGQSPSVRITGYQVSNMVNVTVDDIEKVSEVLAAVMNAGANSVHGINFTVEDSAALEERAREAAMSDARSRAEALAELAGVELGEVLTLSTSTSPGYPVPMMAGRSRETADAAAAPAPGISPGRQSVNVQIHATFAIR